MTYKQYKLLKELHSMAPEMDNEQKYKLHYLVDIEKKTNMAKEEILATAKELEAMGYVNLAQNSEIAKERSGFIHLIRITYSGVSSKNSYISNKVIGAIRNILIPAVVSVLCSLLIEYFKQ